MAASYPSASKTFATISNGQASDAVQLNGVYDEVTAVEQGLLAGLQHALKPLTTALYDLGSSVLRWRALYLSGDANIAGAVNVTGAITAGSMVWGGRVSVGLPASNVFAAGNQNNVALSATAALWYVSSNDATNTTVITGIAARTTYDFVFVQNTGANRVTFKSGDTNSSVGNRIQTPRSVDLALDSGDGVSIHYDAGSLIWRIFGYRDGTAGS